MRYIVGIREVYVRDIVVEADNQGDAIEKAKNCENHLYEIDTTYSHELADSFWSVEEFPE